MRKWTPKSLKIDQKWSQEELKIESMRRRWPKTAPDSSQEPPWWPKPGYPGILESQNGGPNLPKSVKKCVKNSAVFFDNFSYRFFFDFWPKSRRKTDKKTVQKGLKKQVEEKYRKSEKPKKNHQFLKVFWGSAGTKLAKNDQKIVEKVG